MSKDRVVTREQFEEFFGYPPNEVVMDSVTTFNNWEEGYLPSGIAFEVFEKGANRVERNTVVKTIKIRKPEGLLPKVDERPAQVSLSPETIRTLAKAMALALRNPHN